MPPVLPPVLPLKRWALTPPFHPCLAKGGRYIFCGAIRHHGVLPMMPLISQGILSCGVRTFLPPQFKIRRATTHLLFFLHLSSQLPDSQANQPPHSSLWGHAIYLFYQIPEASARPSCRVVLSQDF